ncbi:MAG: hypothetical protein AB1730_17785 [Myxococcota bacterium]
MTLEDAVRAVAAALEARDALAAAEAMRGALEALDAARAGGEAPTPELVRLVASCQPLVTQLLEALDVQQRALADGGRATRAYRAGLP